MKQFGEKGRPDLKAWMLLRFANDIFKMLLVLIFLQTSDVINYLISLP